MSRFFNALIVPAISIGAVAACTLEESPKPPLTVNITDGAVRQLGDKAEVLKKTRSGGIAQVAILGCLKGEATLNIVGSTVEFSSGYLRSIAKSSGITDWIPCSADIVNPDLDQFKKTATVAGNVLVNTTWLPR